VKKLTACHLSGAIQRDSSLAEIVHTPLASDFVRLPFGLHTHISGSIYFWTWGNIKIREPLNLDVNVPTDTDWMRQALNEAAQVNSDVPVGAIIVMAGKIIGRGHNLREMTGDPTAHAEIIAIRQAATNLKSWRLTGAELYTTLEPCPMCAEALLQARVSRLVFGAYDPRSGAAGSAFNLFTQGRTYPLPEILGGICEDECQKLLLQFFRETTNR
jgi:tRNA(adenine34) deaminase